MGFHFQLLRFLASCALLVLIPGFSSSNTLAVAPTATLSTYRLDARDTTFTTVSAGGHHACGLTANGGVKCWGENDSGQLGDGTTVARHTPVDVIGLTGGVIAIAAGSNHTCALTNGGGVKCWGSDIFGRLGDGGSAQTQPTPVDVVGLDSGVIAIAAGEAQTCAVTSGGAAKCWGWNRRGVLGDGTTDTRRTPTDVRYLSSGVKSIATGMFHSCAVLVSGGAKCWGAAGYGQLGNGRTDDEYAPVDVLGATGVTAISTGLYHTCAIANGGVKCWGNNNYGQLGDGTTANHSTPIDVTSFMHGALVIDSGSNYNCALTDTGRIKCWGSNFAGELGDGTSLPRSAPVDVIWVNNAGALSSGTLFSCTVYGGGSLRCWGNTSDFVLSNHVYLPSVQSTYSAPQARFTPEPAQGLAPLTVHFDNTSTGSSLSSSWEFGDGVTDTLANPSHIYQLAGTYTATLTVTDGLATDATSHTIEALPSRDLLINGGFEQGLWAWQWNDFPDRADVVTTTVHSGTYAAKLGIEPSDPLEYSYATATYSAGALYGVQHARLSFWYWPRREGPAGDPERSRQFAYVLEGDKILQKLFEFDENSSGWQYAEFDLSQYAGRSISIQFGVYHDGNAVYDKRSALYVDDVSLLIDAEPFPILQLAAYYPFNGDAHDASGNGNEGVVHGATLTSDRFGMPNSAYQFNGSSDYISVGYNSSLSFPQDLTVAAWIKTTDDAGGIVHEHNGYTDGNFVFGLSQGGRFRFGRSAILVSGQYDSQHVNDNQWHLVVGVFDHTHGLVKHYVDGALVLTYNDIDSLPDSHIPLIIGDENNHLYAFDGAIDDVRLYSRVLSDEEIAALWQAVR